MIDIRDGELYDLLRFSSFSGDVDSQCLSYALKVGLALVLERLIRIQTHSAIDEQPEKTVDALAEELRAPYYDQNLPLDVKREIDKKAISWHYRAGTPSAVEELLQVVYGGGELIEWWDFEDPPYDHYTFDLETNAPLRPETWGRVLDMLDRVKNVRSHLRRLIYKRKAEIEWGAGLSLKSIPERYTASWPEGDRETGIPAITGGSFQSAPLHTATPHESESQAEMETVLALAVVRYFLRIADAAQRDAEASLQTRSAGSLDSVRMRIGQPAERQAGAELTTSAAYSLESKPVRFTRSPDSTVAARLTTFAAHALESQAVHLTHSPDRSAAAQAAGGLGLGAAAMHMRTSIRSPDRTARMTGRFFSGTVTPIPLRTNA